MSKPRTHKAMVEYLSTHFRYSTMNSWNNSTSYARKIKIHSLGLDHETENVAYDMLEVAEAFYDFNDVLREFDSRHFNTYQIWSNGRSGGYLVLGQGGQRPSKHKSVCTACGQRNYEAVPEGKTGQCGRCGKKTRINRQFPPDVYATPGKSLDMGEDFTDWDVASLRDRVNLVWDFDKTCERAVQAFIAFCKGHRAVKKTIKVPKEIMVAEEI